MMCFFLVRHPDLQTDTYLYQTKKLFHLSCSLLEVVAYLSSQLDSDAFGSQGHINCLLTLARALRDANSCYLTLLRAKIKEVVPGALTVRLVEAFQDIFTPPACFQVCEYNILHSVYSKEQENLDCASLFE